MKANRIVGNAEIARRTKRILALKKEERKAAGKLASVVADIGDELIAVKESLDRGPDKTAWMRWLRTGVRFSIDSAQNYMSVARLRQNNRKRFRIFAGRLNVSCLLRIAGLPDEIRDGLAPDTVLPVPGKPAPKALQDMSARELDRALDAVERGGAAGPAVPRAMPPVGSSREAYVRSAAQALADWVRSLDDVRKLSGSLSPEAKLDFLDSVDAARRWGLKLPRWAWRKRGVGR